MKLALESLDFKTDPLENYYELHEELGRGNFAVVKKCRNKESNEEFAAKCITKKRSKASKKGMSKDAIQTEASILLSVDHDGVIKLYDIFETRQNITLVMELLTGGELFEEISKEEFILEKDACHYMKQILDAVGHLHENNIVHLDLKPENIVLKNKGEKDIKLVDFGLARKLEPGVEHREMMGTPEFAAPETISFDPIGYYTDMWALGVVTYILLSGASPFLGDDDQETYQNITSCEYDFDDEYFSKITENAKDFIRRLLLKNGSKRNTVKDCLKHPWIACEEEENSVIDTKKMRAFVARRRWKQSLRMVTMISRLRVLARNSSPTSDTSGDESDSDARKEETPKSNRNVARVENEVDMKHNNKNVHHCDTVTEDNTGIAVNENISGNGREKDIENQVGLSVDESAQGSLDSETCTEDFKTSLAVVNKTSNEGSWIEPNSSMIGLLAETAPETEVKSEIDSNIEMQFPSRGGGLTHGLDNNNNVDSCDDDYFIEQTTEVNVSKEKHEVGAVDERSLEPNMLQNDLEDSKLKSEVDNENLSAEKLSVDIPNDMPIQHKDYSKTIGIHTDGNSGDSCPTFVLKGISDGTNPSSKITFELEMEPESEEEIHQSKQIIQCETASTTRQDDTTGQQQISLRSSLDNPGNYDEFNATPFTFKVTSISASSADHAIIVPNSEKPSKEVSLTILQPEAVEDSTVTGFSSNAENIVIQDESIDSGNPDCSSEKPNAEVNLRFTQSETMTPIDSDILLSTSAKSDEEIAGTSQAFFQETVVSKKEVGRATTSADDSGIDMSQGEVLTQDANGNVSLVLNSSGSLGSSAESGCSVFGQSCSVACEKKMLTGNGTKVVVQLFKSNSIS